MQPHHPARLFETVLTPLADTLPGAAILKLQGFFDARAIHDFDGGTQRALDEGHTLLILDTQDLAYISSAGLGALMRLSQHLVRTGGDIVFLPPPEKILAIFELLDFAKVLKFANSQEQALEILRSKH